MNTLNNSLLAPQGSLYGGYAQQIAERTMRLLIQQDLVVPGTTNAPVFYSWPRPDRLVLVFDPMRLKNIEAVLGLLAFHLLPRWQNQTMRAKSLMETAQRPRLRGTHRPSGRNMSGATRIFPIRSALYRHPLI